MSLQRDLLTLHLMGVDIPIEAHTTTPSGLLETPLTPTATCGHDQG